MSLAVASAPIRVEEHLGLANKVARSLRARAAVAGLEPEDLAQAALLGLLLVAHRFDPGRGKASTFAGRVFRWAILNHLQRQKPFADAPTVLNEHGLMDDFFACVEARPGKDAGDAMDEPARVERLLSALTRRERRIVEKRFGLTGGHGPMALRELAMLEGVSRQMIGQVLDQAFTRMRRAAGLPEPETADTACADYNAESVEDSGCPVSAAAG